MTRQYNKGNIHKAKAFENLHDRFKKAKELGMYFESVVILYSLFEDRTRSYISKLGETAEDTLFKNLELLKKEISDNQIHSIIDRINIWRRDRNKLIHDLVEEEIGNIQKNLNVINKRRLVEDGYKILREFEKEMTKYIKK